MSKMRSWILLFLIVVCGCGGSTAADLSDAAPGAQEVSPEVEVVIALIEAFQAGDQARVEELWARDGGTWTNAEGFRQRAAYFQKAEFDLDPRSITTTGESSPQVVVKARQDDQDHIWIFHVLEIKGTLRAGGVETRPAGLP